MLPNMIRFQLSLWTAFNISLIPETNNNARWNFSHHSHSFLPLPHFDFFCV